jgi:hypothetical protein
MVGYAWSLCWTETLINAVWSCYHRLIVIFSSIDWPYPWSKHSDDDGVVLQSVAFPYCGFRDLVSCVLLIFSCFTILPWWILYFYFYIIVRVITKYSYVQRIIMIRIIEYYSIFNLILRNIWIHTPSISCIYGGGGLPGFLPTTPNKLSTARRLERKRTLIYILWIYIILICINNKII